MMSHIFSQAKQTSGRLELGGGIGLDVLRVFVHASSRFTETTQSEEEKVRKMTGSSRKEQRDASMRTALIIFLSTCQDHNRPRNRGRSSGDHMQHPHSVPIWTRGTEGQKGSLDMLSDLHCDKVIEEKLAVCRSTSAHFCHHEEDREKYGRTHMHTQRARTHTHTTAHMLKTHRHACTRVLTHTQPSCSPQHPSGPTSRLAPAAGRVVRFERPTCRRCSTSAEPRLSLSSLAGQRTCKPW